MSKPMIGIYCFITVCLTFYCIIVCAIIVPECIMVIEEWKRFGESEVMDSSHGSSKPKIINKTIFVGHDGGVEVM